MDNHAKLSLVPDDANSDEGVGVKPTDPPELVGEEICQKCGHFNPASVDFHTTPCQACGYLIGTSYDSISNDKVDEIDIKPLLVAIIPLIIFVFFKIISDPTVKGPGSIYEFTYNEKLINIHDGDSPAVMIIALHGYGGNHTRSRLFEDFDKLKVPVRIIALRGPFDAGFGGYSWVESVHDYIEVGDSIAASVSELINKFPTKGKPIILGFSQGAILGYYLAIHHPDKFSYIFPVAGQSYPEFMTEHQRHIGKYPPIHAYHGRGDRFVPLIKASTTVASLRKMSVDVNLNVYDGVGHEIPQKMRHDLFKDLETVIHDMN